MTKRRVTELAEAMISMLHALKVDRPVALGVAKAIQERCEGCVRIFKR